MSADRDVISLTKLNVRRDIPILTDISWRVQRGEHWVMLGANGSGKTSLLNALSGYLTPGTGKVSVLGQTYGKSDWRDLRLHIGLVSASLVQRIEPGETALEIVASGKTAMINYWGKISDEDKKQAKGILKQVECTALAEREWKYLSQGERQRVLIGRALMANFKLLLLDEPCAGLDPVARERFLQFLERLARQRNAPTLVLVTHHVEEIRPCFTHMLLIKSGRAMAAGRIKDVLTSQNLSAAFGVSVNLSLNKKQYQLSLTRKSSLAL